MILTTIFYCYDLYLHPAVLCSFPSVPLNLYLSSSFLSRSLRGARCPAWQQMEPWGSGTTHIHTHTYTHRELAAVGWGKRQAVVKTDVNISMNMHMHTHTESMVMWIYVDEQGEHKSRFRMEECIQSHTHTHTHTHTHSWKINRKYLTRFKTENQIKEESTQRECLPSLHLCIYHSSLWNLELIWVSKLQNTELGGHLGIWGLLFGTKSTFPLVTPSIQLRVGLLFSNTVAAC